MTKIRISCAQLAAVIVICRIHTLMTHIPLIGTGFSAASELIGVTLSAALCCLIVLPSVSFYKKHENMGIITCISERNHALGLFFGITAVAALLLAGSHTVSDFTAFSSERFVGGFGELLTAFLLILTCLYAAYCGIEGIARSTAVIFLLFFIMLILMFSGSADKFSAENLRADISGNNILSSFIDDFIESSEIITLIFCGKYAGEKYRMSAYLSLFFRLFATAFITLAVILVLGDYAFICKYPFLDVGSAAGIRFFQRIDALYMIIWVVTAVISIALKIFTAGEILKELFPSLRAKNTVSAAALFICAAIFNCVNSAGNTAYLILFPLTAIIVPLFAANSVKREKRT